MNGVPANDVPTGPVIFLSYARIDNEDVPGRPGSGWITHFDASLRHALNRAGRTDIRIWRDTDDIAGADRFPDKIKEALSKASAFLPVLSPNYPQRPWCKEEMQRIADRIENEPGFDGLVFPVFMTEVPVEDRHALLHNRAGYPFWKEDPDNKKLVIHYYDDGERRRPDFSTAMALLVADIKTRLPRQGPQPPQTVNPDGMRVFLARPAIDMQAAYDKLALSLMEGGFRVVPDPAVALPATLHEAEAMLTAALGEAKLVVHLLGVPAGQSVGPSQLADLQLQLSSGHAAPRMAWVPQILLLDPTAPDSSVLATERDAFAVLRKFGGFRDGDSVIDQPFELFRKEVLSRCQDLRPPPPRQALPLGPARVYVVGDEKDGALVDQVAALLGRDHNLHATASVFDEKTDDEAKLHEQQLIKADAVLVCWGNAGRARVSLYASEASDFSKTRRKEPYRVTGLLRAGPPHPRKAGFFNSDIQIVLPSGGSVADPVTAQELLPFVQAVRGS